MIERPPLALAGDRYTPFSASLVFTGIDLTGAVMKMQIRDRKDGGAVRATLNTVTTDVEGLRLLSVAEVGGVDVSTVSILIAEATMDAMPTAPAIGDDHDLWWDLHVTIGGLKQVWLEGEFTVRAGVTQ